MGKIYKNGIEYGGGGGGSAGHTILDNDGNTMPAEDNLQFKGLDVTDNSTDGVTEVESIGLNQDSLDDVTDGSIGNEIINNGMTYSTNEQIVGKWIDGKPIYQRTVTKTIAHTNGRVWYDIADLTASNIETMIEMTGVYYDSAINGWLSIDSPRYWTFNPAIAVYSFIQYEKSSNQIRFCLSSDTPSTQNVHITIRYTKSS